MNRPPPVRCLPLADQRGVVFLEFLIAFVPMWAFFLCIVQLAFITHANLMVKHSADSAARSAVVVLPDDPNEYGGEPEMSVDRNRVTASDIVEVLGRVGSTLRDRPNSDSVVSAFSDQTLANLGRSRLNTIRLAAHIPLMPLAPMNVGVVHDNIAILAPNTGQVVVFDRVGRERVREHADFREYFDYEMKELPQYVHDLGYALGEPLNVT